MFVSDADDIYGGPHYLFSDEYAVLFLCYSEMVGRLNLLHSIKIFATFFILMKNDKNIARIFR